jgi:hypothetical protein
MKRLNKIDLEGVLVLKNFETGEVKFYTNLLEANKFCSENPSWGLKGKL